MRAAFADVAGHYVVNTWEIASVDRRRRHRQRHRNLDSISLRFSRKWIVRKEPPFEFYFTLKSL